MKEEMHLDEHMQWLAWGGLYAAQEKSAFMTLSTGCPPEKMKRKVLKVQNDIHTRTEGILWMMGASMRAEDILFGKPNIYLEDKDFEMLKKENIVEDKMEVWNLTSIGWEIGRISFLARACFDAGFFSEEEAWRYIKKAHDYGISFGFGNWDEFSKSYLIGMIKHQKLKQLMFRTVIREKEQLQMPGNIWDLAAPIHKERQSL